MDKDEATLKGVVEAVGGAWEDVRKDWTQVDAEVRKGIKPLTKEHILAQIVEVATAHTGEGLPKSDIQELLKQTSPWAMVKKHGKSLIPNGQAQTAFARLDATLRGLGVFVVPVGEVENFCPEIGLHGPKHVSKLFETYQLDANELQSLRKFVAGVFGN